MAVAASSASVVSADHIEETQVHGQRVYPVQVIEAPQQSGVVDTAELLKQLPGANVNANGKLTGIAQYRGMFGDRVAVSVDGLSLVTGGPNAMDSPLSYASPLLLKKLSLERGIASVSSAAESIGGHFNAEYDRGAFTFDDAFSLSGSVQTRAESNGDHNSSAARLIASSNKHKMALLAAIDRGDDRSFPNGDILPSELQRDRFDLSYALNLDGTEVLIYAGRMDTEDSGTPALPMDIVWIESDLFGGKVKQEFGRTVFEAALSYSDVDHAMDNFSLRTAPTSPMGFRQTRAFGEGSQWRLGSTTTFSSGVLRLGLDGSMAEHSATITNPKVAAFRIQNFNDVERDALGAYVQWNQSISELDVEAGLRLNKVSYDAGNVSAAMPAMMAMMLMNANALADRFNTSNRDQDHSNIDAVVKIGKRLNEKQSVYIELAQKNKAPSYQQLFLWLPMQATAGLADGRSYIGNVNLDSEVSREINIGSDWQSKNAWFTPQLFYKDIGDYIQGVNSNDMRANMAANMMGGQGALQFSNVDAEIYGFDLAWGLRLREHLSLEGVINYSRGKRKDVADNLYRLAPLNTRVALIYELNNWQLRSDVIAYAKQDKVSATSNERETSGYAVLNVAAQWQLNKDLMFSFAVDNLLDKQYQEHLGGVNRVRQADIAVGDRLYANERNFKVGITYNF